MVCEYSIYNSNLTDIVVSKSPVLTSAPGLTTVAISAVAVVAAALVRTGAFLPSGFAVAVDRALILSNVPAVGAAPKKITNVKEKLFSFFTVFGALPPDAAVSVGASQVIVTLVTGADAILANAGLSKA